jgi:hypothetical protein
MPKTLDTDKFTIGSLLGRYERRRVVLPEFQRSYSWEKAQVATFWEDLGRFENEYTKSPSIASYFLGPIVLIEREDSLLLLDGQQRLATATIAFAAMRDVGRSVDRVGNTKGADLARDIQRELVEKDTDPTSYSLTLSDLDEPYFLKAVKADPPAVPQTKLRSHNLIQAAYNQSVERVRNLIKGHSEDDALRRLKSLRDAVSKGMTLVGIVVQSEDDAYTIFETLNDRGLRLSVPDLVLNLLMRRAPDATSKKLVRQHWNAMLRELGKRDVSRFLRHFWVSRYGDLKAEGLFGAIKRELESAQLDSATFAEQCADECEDYVQLLDANVPLPSREGITYLDGIVRYLQVASAPPLLLAGYRALNPHDFEKLLKAIVTTHLRFVVLTNQNPLDLESRLYESARLIRQMAAAGDSSGKALQAAKTKLKQLAVSYASMQQAVEDVYLERAEALWIMTALANSMQSATKEVGMDKANLEHVFPQNPKISGWPNMSALEGLTWHLGNLTILGEKLNRAAQNRGFKDKCSLHYGKSEIEMTKNLLKYQAWDEAQIKSRAKELVGEVDKVWPSLQ